VQKQRIALIAGIVLGTIAFFLGKMYLDQQTRILEEKKQQELVKIEKSRKKQTAVLVAKQDIPKGSEIETKMVDAKIIPNQFLQPRVVTTMDRIEGMISIAPISKGEQITLTKLTSREKAIGGSLAMAVPMGKRAVTIAVDNIASLVGMLKGGDYVDIIAMLPDVVKTAGGKEATQMNAVPIFQNVLVLAIGQRMAVTQEGLRGDTEKTQRPEASSYATLALKPQEANFITFLQDQVKIRLLLRSPADSKLQLIQPANWNSLYQYLNPPPTAPSDDPMSSPTGEYVEIYRGLRKGRIPISPEK